MTTATDVAASTLRSFRAMGSDVEVRVVGDDDGSLHTLARDTIDELERRWSRFLPDSDISRINAAAGAAVCVDPATVELVVAMVNGWAATQGAFDPTLLAPLVGLGYAAAWDGSGLVTSLPAGAVGRVDADRIRIDRAAAVVVVPVGTALDPGGIGKGLAADRTVAALVDAGAAGAMVSIGGDVRVAGRAPHPDGWLVGVADGSGPDRQATSVRILDGGVATSGTRQRAWRDAVGRPVHHLLDPATLQPLPTDARAVVTATVIAGTAAWAEVWTKALAVRGVRALDAVEALGLAGRVLLADGAVVVTSAWDGFGPAVGPAVGHLGASA